MLLCVVLYHCGIGIYLSAESNVLGVFSDALEHDQDNRDGSEHQNDQPQDYAKDFFPVVGIENGKKYRPLERRSNRAYGHRPPAFPNNAAL